MPKNMKRLIAILLIVAIMLQALALPVMASFSKIAKQEKIQSLLFQGINLDDLQKEQIINNFDNLPKDPGKWTATTISIGFLSDINLEPEQKTELVKRVLKNRSAFSEADEEEVEEVTEDEGQETGSGDTDTNDTGENPWSKDTDDLVSNNKQDRGTIMETLLALPFQGLTAALGAFGIQSLPKLFFAQDISTGKPTPGMEIGGVFSNNEWEEVIQPWFLGIQATAWLLMAITISIQGMGIAWSDSSPSLKAELQDKFRRWILAAVFIALTPFIVQFLFDINLTAISVAAKHCLESNVVDSNTIDVDGVLLSAVVNFVFIMMIVWFNFRYLLRKLVIVLLIIIAPLAAWSASFQKRNIAFNLWLTELIGNIAIQTAHAWVFAIIVGGLFAGDYGGIFGLANWWVKLALIGFLHPVSNLLVRIINGLFDLLGLPEDSVTNQGVSGFMAPFKGVQSVASAIIGGSGGAQHRQSIKNTTARNAEAALGGAAGAGAVVNAGGSVGGNEVPGLGANSQIQPGIRSQMSRNISPGGMSQVPGFETTPAGLMVPAGTKMPKPQQPSSSSSGSSSLGGQAGGFVKKATGAALSIPQIDSSTGETMDTSEYRNVVSAAAGGLARGAVNTAAMGVSLVRHGPQETFGYKEDASGREKALSIGAGVAKTAASYLPMFDKPPQQSDVDTLRFS